MMHYQWQRQNELLLITTKARQSELTNGVRVGAEGAVRWDVGRSTSIRA